MTILKSITIVLPDDAHLHLRDGDILTSALPFTVQQMGRAIIMPNLTPPVLTAHDAIDYKKRIISSLPANAEFEPLMTVYLTEKTRLADLQQGFEQGVIVAAKLYPAGATTNSDAGIKNVENIYSLLAGMEKMGMPLLCHGEVVDPEVDIFDREAVFIDKVLVPVRKRFPNLKIVLEHITTEQGVDYVKSCDSNVAATITPHHLVINRNHMLVGGIKPHYYCLPVAKREKHRLALRKAATSNDSRFFLGTDSAPHMNKDKESACGCAGIFNAPVCLPILAQVFEEENALSLLENFTSKNGALFYNLLPNERSITIEKHDVLLPKYDDVSGSIKVFDPGFPIYWKLAQ